MVFVLAGISVHPVWLALVGSYLLGLRARPPGTSSASTSRHSRCSRSRATARSPGAAPGEHCGGPVDWFYHLLLPWSVFAFLYAAFYVRLVRSQVMEVQNEDYVRTARAKGAPERRVLTQHVLRNAMLPVVTAFGMDVALALGGAVLLESVYGLPGLGYVAIKSLSQFDYPITLGVVVFASVVVIIFNLIVDLLYAWIDPRIRLG